MKRSMKKGLLMVVSTVFMFGCAGEKEKSIGDLLHDAEKRKEIMTTICEDQEMMADMMKYMMASENAMNSMNESHDMFAKMMGDEQMMKGKMMNDMGMMMDKKANCKKLHMDTQNNGGTH